MDHPKDNALTLGYDEATQETLARIRFRLGEGLMILDREDSLATTHREYALTKLRSAFALTDPLGNHKFSDLDKGAR